MSARRLVADVGGTNVRFALADAWGNLDRVKIFLTADFPTFLDAFDAYRTYTGGSKEVNAAVIAAAGPVDGNIVKLTNNEWVVDRMKLSALMGDVPVLLVNDLEAVAASLSHLTGDDLTTLGPVAPVPPPHRRTMLAVNVGTGFGAASAIRSGLATCPSEAGHMTLGPVEGTTLPADTSVEDVLSGAGLVRLYRSLGGGPDSRPASDIFALAATDAAAARALDIFTTVLGRVAGNLALATCAWSGVYLCGSVATAWAGVADIGQFRAEFIRKGPMRSRMQNVPTALIRRDNAALFGLAVLPMSLGR
ncbi:MAG: glucokinase [Xanthobacteraceae bacterium]|nr:glucokinase [Xanthobacteraceae bacterium]